MRKILTVLIAVCIMSSLSMICSFADSESEFMSPDITVMNLYTNSIAPKVSKSGSKVNYNCDVSGKSSATKISMYVYLQEYSGGVWKDVDVVTKEVNGRNAYASDTYTGVSGRKYRTNAHIYVYSGSKYEYLESTSTTLVF